MTNAMHRRLARLEEAATEALGRAEYMRRLRKHRMELAPAEQKRLDAERDAQCVAFYTSGTRPTNPAQEIQRRRGARLLAERGAA